LFGDDVETLYRSVLEAADGVDAVLAFPATFPALDVAEHLNLPVIQVHHVPSMPTRTFPAAVNFVHQKSLGSIGNQLSYSADAAGTTIAMRRPMNAARERVLGAGRSSVRNTLRQRKRFAGAVIGVSPRVLPPPTDWPTTATTCGYWWPGATDLPDLDPSVVAFIEGGDPTVFFTLGSTTLEDPSAITDAVVGAAKDSGVRLILQRGWGGLGNGVESDDVLVVDDLTYPELFDRVSAVIHHGGAGTTALGLRHGKPSLAIPAIADQFFWGHRMHALGVGPAPLALKSINRAELAARMRSLVLDKSHADAAAQLANQIASEDGVSTAVAAINRYLDAA
jgi:UDP:flavonoid glycosyltransferase YjiC (YdhE family)